MLVAGLTAEVATGRVQNWLAAREPGSLAISDWVRLEFSSALAIKLRTGQLDAPRRADALATLTRLVLESFILLPVASEHCRVAAKFVDQHALGLRSGDALHLAICAAHGASLCTLDRRLGEAGPAVGVKTLLV